MVTLETSVKRFDLIVIGTGPAASTTATRCRTAGWQVAIVDSKPFGGTCALRGCDPKKVLIGAADVLNWGLHMRGKGLKAEVMQIDWPELMRFKRSFTDRIPERREVEFANAGISTFHGRARFVGPTSLGIGEERIEGKNVVIAAGDAPIDLKIPGAHYLTTSDQFLDLTELPPRILFLGGGYIAFEFAHLAALAGARVSVIHGGSRPLPRFDPDLVDQLIARTCELSVDLHSNTKAISIEKSASEFIIKASRYGLEVDFRADMVVHAAGRSPDLDDLDLDVAGIEWDERGVRVNEFLQSVSNPAIYAAGDAAASEAPHLSPVAGYEGRLVAENLLKGNHETPNYLGVPTVVFTIPPLAAVGMNECDARKHNLRYKIKTEDTSELYSSGRIAETCSGYKLVVEEDSDRILGAHVLGSRADEIINLFAIAIRTGLPATELKHMLFAYPTGGSTVPRML